jgi:cyclopropane-fatty-acyl-phospholipid synthase
MAAREYGVSGLGVTLSEEQLKHSRLAACEAGVDHLVKFELTNFQDLPAAGHLFDRVLSVGMFEHVGRAGMAAYFDVVARLLKPAGVTLLHTISTIDTHGGNDAWMDKYIFPGGYIPAVREIIDLLPRHDLRPIDYESLRLHYALTLDEWLRRYELHAAEVRAERGDQFYRMWQMYLTTCAGNFRSGGLDLSQFVMVKGLNNSLPLTREYLYRD